MKIVTLVNEFPPQKIGGVGISTYNTAKCLSKRGHEVHVVTIFNEKVPAAVFDKDLHVHPIPWVKIKFIGNLLFSLQTLRKLKKMDPDIIHVQGLWMGIPAYFAKKIYKIPFVVSGHGSDVYLQSKLLIHLRSKPILKNADAVVALTTDMQKAMQKICKRDVLVIPNGINLKKFNNILLENTNNDTNSTTTILFVGALVPVKGVKYLLESIRKVADICSNVRLVLIGDGPDREKLESYAKELNINDYVSFLGQVPNQKIPHYMAKSDIFVLPSLSEGFGIVLLEAMAAGLPIVASNVGGIPTLVQNGVNGFLVEPKNSCQIAEKISLLIGNNKIVEAMSQYNTCFVKKYSLEKTTEDYESIFTYVNENRKKQDFSLFSILFPLLSSLFIPTFILFCRII